MCNQSGRCTLIMDIRQQNYPLEAPPPTSSNNGFPIIAIAIIGIIATILILVSYYIFVTSCCFRLKHFLNPSSSTLQRFSFRRHNQELLFMQSRRGLDDRMIHEIPTFEYRKTKEEGEEHEESNISSSLFKCVVCLNEFQDHDLLRLLPNCNHAFHIDCIDVWLQNNVNCPLCRASLIGEARDQNIAPNTSPQQPIIISRRVGSDEHHYVMVHVTRHDTTDSSFRIGTSTEEGQSSRRSEYKVSGKLTSKKKNRHVSVMGDECINVREENEEFCLVKPIRRSFSMDSAADNHHVYLSVQEMLRHNNRRLRNINGESSRRSQRSMFSFSGCGRGSENAVLPLGQL